MDKKIEETREFLQIIGMPKAQQADICCYVILAMAGIKRPRHPHGHMGRRAHSSSQRGTAKHAPTQQHATHWKCSNRLQDRGTQ